MNPFLKEENSGSDFDGYYSDAVFNQIAEVIGWASLGLKKKRMAACG